MPQSISHVPLHIVFSTRNRENFINDEVAPGLHAFMAGVFKECGSPALKIGGTADHTHALAMLSSTITIADLIKKVKTASSGWMKTQSRGLRNFHWQNGYGVFGVSESMLGMVKSYIANQKDHHQRSSFQDEFRALLKKHNIPLDETYLWD
jgi:putative transposase